MLHKSELTRFTAIGWNKPDLWLALAVSLLFPVIFPYRFTFTLRDER